MSASKRPRKIVAFDWDSRNLRVVHAAISKRGPRVERLLSVSIPAEVDISDAAQMGGLLRQVLDQERIGTTSAIVDIPRDQAFLNVLTLPCQVPNELPSIVAIQIAKQLPFAVGDAVIDFAVAPHAPDATTADVMVAAVRHEVLKQYEAVFAAAGLKLVQVGLRPFASKIAACELLKHGMPDRVLFIDVGPRLTEINVLRHSFLAFSRAAEVGLAEAKSAGPRLSLVREGGSISAGVPQGDAGSVLDLGEPVADVVNSLLVEVTRSIEAYRAMEPGTRIDHVVIGGDLGVEEDLAERIQQRLRISTELYNPGRLFGWEPDEGANAAGCAATLGLVLGYSADDVPQFDFLHPKRTVSKTQERIKKAPLVAAVLVLFVAAGALGMSAITKPDRTKLAKIQAEIKELKGRNENNKNFLKITDSLRSFDGDQFIWVDVLHDIVSLLPSQEELVITELSLSQKEQKVVLKARIKKSDTIQIAAKSLNEFRREGKDAARFKARPKARTPKAGDAYPFSQDLEIDVLKDESSKRKQG